jgi:hypothetical protein
LSVKSFRKRSIILYYSARNTRKEGPTVVVGSETCGEVGTIILSRGTREDAAKRGLKQSIKGEKKCVKDA